MNVSKLKVGQEIKNYEALCDLLGEVAVTNGGNSKKSHLKEFDRYFKYRKKGYKFIIEEIYDTVKPKEVDYVSIYKDYAFKLILNMIANNENDDILYMTKHNLFRALNLINDIYEIGYKNKKELADRLALENNYQKIPMIAINDVYETTYQKINYILESSLNKLKKEKWLMWAEVFYIKDKDNISREATDIEAQIILSIENMLMNKYGITSTKFLGSRKDRFYRDRYKAVKEALGFEGCVRIIKIIPVQQKCAKERLEKSKELEITFNLNSTLQQQIKHSIDNKYQKSYDNFVHDYYLDIYRIDSDKCKYISTKADSLRILNVNEDIIDIIIKEITDIDNNLEEVAELPF